MSTYNEIAYMIYDSLGLGTDNSRVEIDHVYYLMKEARNSILNQRYIYAKKLIPIANYQTICLDLEHNVDCITGEEVKSIQEMPSLLNLNGGESVIITPIGDMFSVLEWTYIDNQRFKAVGYNKWLKNISYFTTGHDNHLYLKSNNPNYKYIKKVTVSALFNDPLKAAELDCSLEKDCNIYDTPFPLEDTLVLPLIELVVEQLTPVVYKPIDEENNAADNLAGLGVTK